MSFLVKTLPNHVFQAKIVRGEEYNLFTASGERFIDFTSGVTGHSILGYSQKTIIDRIKSQAELICHVDYKMFCDDIREELAATLLSMKRHALDAVYLVGASGGEACEAAMKLSYAYHHRRGNPEKSHFISRKQGYHGSTSDSLAVGDRPNLDLFKVFHPNNRHKISEHNYIRNSEPGESEVDYCDRCVDELRQAILQIGPKYISGFIGETTLGGLVGDVVPHETYWTKIRDLCDEFDIHLIIDEVWCGTGTSGRIYSIDWDNVTPDFIFLGKTLGAGYGAVSGVITRQKIIGAIKGDDGMIPHSITHQGHTLSCAAALEAQKLIHEKNLLDNVLQRSQQLSDIFNSRLSSNPCFKDLRGRGLRLSIEYDTPDNHWFGTTVAGVLREERNILISGKWHRLGFSPALIIDEEVCRHVGNAVCDVFEEITANFSYYKRSKVFNDSFF